ncbi:ATP-binding protein [Streptomyces sp. NPDC005794]|uniref:ATP-binding protein n=1 Tax=Streptomyces sp. NPDC005794 TaxID=3364733 RepID=UPI00369C7D23
MQPYAPPLRRAALCPAGALLPAPGAAPYLRSKSRPHRGLVLSLTLPGDPRSAAVGRRAVAAALPACGLRSLAWPAVLAVSELIAVNAAFTPGRELYLSLRHGDGALRLVLWDQHPRHADPDTLALCEVRRRRALWLLSAVVDDWGGDWGVSEGRPPHQGIKTWTNLPH